MEVHVVDVAERNVQIIERERCRSENVVIVHAFRWKMAKMSQKLALCLRVGGLIHFRRRWDFVEEHYLIGRG
eukprot:6482800-Amphidinium_carterae.4